jgi:hypothetical protein
MANVCSVESCTFDEKYDEKCALHCEKFDYQTDEHRAVIDDFYELLIEYVFMDLKKSRPSINLDLVKFKEYLEGSEGALIELLLRKSTTVIADLHFPVFSVQDRDDFRQILRRLKTILFSECSFMTSQLDLKDIEVSFFSCVFCQEYTLSNHGLLLDGVSETLYYECEFKKKVTFVQSEFNHPKSVYSAPIFGNCVFKDILEANRINFEKRLFINDKTDSAPIGEMSEFHLENCVFNEKFIFNRYKCKSLKIEDCTFKNKVELKNNIVNELDVNNSNFEKLFDAYESKFLICKFRKCIFDDFTGFEKCSFGNHNDPEIDKVEFEYVTFLNFTNFRKAKFYNGLDLENTNLKESPNFLNAFIDEKNTNRETYRIIKHSFDKIGNQIEANNYFSFEMQKYMRELEKSGSKSELLIYRLNKIISNFGASYIKPFFWMLGFAVFYYFLVLGYKYNVLYLLFDNDTNECIDWFAKQVNLFAKGIPPYGKLLKEGMEFVTLLFHIIFLTCTWQFIVAVKRRTKR